jgi:hypothetical protein
MQGTFVVIVKRGDGAGGAPGAGGTGGFGGFGKGN